MMKQTIVDEDSKDIVGSWKDLWSLAIVFILSIITSGIFTMIYWVLSKNQIDVSETWFLSFLTVFAVGFLLNFLYKGSTRED